MILHTDSTAADGISGPGDDVFVRRGGSGAATLLLQLVDRLLARKPPLPSQLRPHFKSVGNERTTMPTAALDRQFVTMDLPTGFPTAQFVAKPLQGVYVTPADKRPTTAFDATC